jgi:hypothetical protein
MPPAAGKPNAVFQRFAAAEHQVSSRLPPDASAAEAELGGEAVGGETLGGGEGGDGP